MFRVVYTPCINLKKTLPKQVIDDLAPIEIHLESEPSQFNSKSYVLPNEKTDAKEWLHKKLADVTHQLNGNMKKRKETEIHRAKGYVKLNFAALMKSAYISEHVTKGVKHIEIEGKQKLHRYSLKKNKTGTRKPKTIV